MTRLVGFAIDGNFGAVLKGDEETEEELREWLGIRLMVPSENIELCSIDDLVYEQYAGVVHFTTEFGELT